MRFTHVLDKWDVSFFQGRQQSISEAIKSLDMRDEYRYGSIRELGDHLSGVHAKVAGVDIHEYRDKTVLKN